MLYDKDAPELTERDVEEGEALDKKIRDMLAVEVKSAIDRTIEKVLADPDSPKHPRNRGDRLKVVAYRVVVETVEEWIRQFFMGTETGSNELHRRRLSKPVKGTPPGTNH
jgi:hypothetical protein